MTETKKVASIPPLILSKLMSRLEIPAPVAALQEACAKTGARVVELHTGSYCDATDPAKAEKLLKRLVGGAEYAHALGLQVNAGHGINLTNIDGILAIPYLDTLNIGHSIVARAVFQGLEKAVREMLAAMSDYRL